MKGIVTKLCSLDDIRIPEEMLTVTVDPAEVEDALRRLSLRYAEQTKTQTVEQGDLVTCRADATSYPDGRNILLYTGLDSPGAAEAVQAVLGQPVGASFNVELAGKPVQLTIEQNVHLIPAVVTDALVASMGLENVQTVAAYRQHVQEKLRADQITEKSKMAVGWLVTQMMEGSTFAYDEAELDAYFSEHMTEIRAEYQSYGMEASEDDIRRDMTEQIKQSWLAQAFCQSRGIEIDQASIEEETDQMLEMMSLMGEKVPDRETALEETLRNAYSMELFTGLEKLVKEKMGG